MNNLDLLQTFNSSELSDALDSLKIEGALLGIMPLAPGHKLIGPAYTVKYTLYETTVNGFKNAGNYIDHVPKDAVIMIDNEGREDCTTWGGILTQVALYKGIKGTVIHGACRDVQVIRDLNYPVFTRAITMRSGKNRVCKMSEQIEINMGGVVVRPGDIIFADDCGVLVIPEEHVQEIIEKAGNIQLTEDSIVQAVQQGMSLEEARNVHRYDMPWLGQEEKRPN